ncbi:MAG: response regulator [Myxococcus sp.]|nr:response regulator [Myxococcus sp.]
MSIDKSQFEQVLLNLVANARDAMASGGELFLSIEVSAAHVCLVARDTGEGMEESVRARIFDPFFTTKSVGRGTGLGLATVAQVVSRAGGEVAVESRLKEGTTFRVVLPRVSAESRRPEGPAASPARNGRLTVLVLDDEPRVRDVTAEHLRSFGFHVETVSDPREFRARIAAPEPLEVLVTDVAMPVVGGVELAREALATRPSIGLVFMSGYATDPAVGELVASGRARFLAKPFTKEQLREAVEAAVGSGPCATTERPR